MTCFFGFFCFFYRMHNFANTKFPDLEEGGWSGLEKMFISREYRFNFPLEYRNSLPLLMYFFILWSKISFQMAKFPGTVVPQFPIVSRRGSLVLLLCSVLTLWNNHEIKSPAKSSLFTVLIIWAFTRESRSELYKGKLWYILVPCYHIDDINRQVSFYFRQTAFLAQYCQVSLLSCCYYQLLYISNSQISWMVCKTENQHFL